MDSSFRENGENGSKIVASQEFIKTLEVLGPIEVKVLKMTAKQLRSRDIAEVMYLSVRTIEKYKENIRAVIGVKGPGSLRQWCREHVKVMDAELYVE